MELKKQIDILNGLGYGKKTIARELGLARNTVRSYLEAAEDAKVEIDNDSRQADLQDYFPYCQKELQRTGVTRQILWAEYRGRYPGGYSYSQFCEYLKKWLDRKDVSLHIEQQPGDKLYVDFAGSKMQIADPYTGEIREVEVFVAVLDYSGKTYVRACESQRKEDFLSCIVRALNYFGGVPKVLVIDNLKSGVDKANSYEADINRDLLDLCNHYGMAIMPARSLKPRDKAWVERMVQIVYTRIYAPLRNETFTNLDNLNDAIVYYLGNHNDTPLQGRNESRNDLFESEEKKHLGPLPHNYWELKEYLQVQVMKNCHIRLHRDRHYYSVPYQFIGKKVKLVYSVTYIAVYYGGERIAYHLRDQTPFKYTTVKDHLPSSHQFVSEWNPVKFIDWSARIHPDVESYIRKVLDNKSYPEQTYRSCVGILSFERKAGKERLIAACQRASSYGVYNYKVISQIISNKLDRVEITEKQITMPLHDNIRGATYYK
ncbi:MAG TPA: IS21 family transposase [Chitinispirillaceae bacterium]|nr:IS21 family transposase [Chitinispirillaceae bacterium]